MTATEAPPQGRQLPHDLEAEAQLLGAMMLDSNRAGDVLAVVGPDDFYKPAHGHVFDGVVGVLEQGAKADPVTVADLLRRRGLLDVVGGPGVLIELVSNTHVIGNLRKYAEIVARYAVLRRMRGAVNEAADALDARDMDRASQWIERARNHAADNASDALDFEDVASVLRGEVTSVEPTILRRTDGQRLIYPGLLHWLMGEPGKGKTWVALYATAEVLMDGGSCVYLDWEGNRVIVGDRLAAMGVTEDAVHRLFYLRPKTFTNASAQALAAVCANYGVDLVVGDGTAKALARQGLNEDKASDVLAWLEMVVHPLTEAGAAVLLLDHVAKDKESRAQWARGSGAKIGEVSGAAWMVRPKKLFSRRNPGHFDLVQAKDREGFTAADGDTVAVFHVTPHDLGKRIDIRVDPPEHKPETAAGDKASWDGPTECMDSVLAVLQSAPTIEFSKTRLVEAVRVAGHQFRDRTVGEAAARLAIDGRISYRKGRSNADLYSWHPGSNVTATELHPAGDGDPGPTPPEGW